MASGIAIDVGAYECKAAIIRGENVDAERLLYGDPLFSVAYVDKDNNIIIKGARELAERNPERAFFDVKRRILQGEKELPNIPGVSYIDLYVAMIKETINRCNVQLMKNGDELIEHVVLTVPGFLEERDTIIAEMKRAAESIEVGKGKKLSVDLLVEPAGVGIHNLDAIRRNQPEMDIQESHTQIIYDLGHSTLDVALVTSYNDADTAYELHSFRTDDETFGEYFDKRIEQRILSFLEENGTDIERLSKRAGNRIKRAAAEMKHGLSEADEYTVSIDIDGDYVDFTLTREQFEELVVVCLRNSADLVRDAMETAEEKGIKVGEIILAGGGSSIPLVKKCVEEVAGDIPVKRSLRPIDAVSFGAARYGLLHNLVQRAKRSYGIQLPVRKGTLERNVQMMAQSDVALPYKSKALKNAMFVCDADGVFRTTLYSYDKKESRTTVPADDCNQIRHMTFEISPNEPVELSMEINEEHCVKVICKTASKGSYVMTSFDSANTRARKEG